MEERSKEYEEKYKNVKQTDVEPMEGGVCNKINKAASDIGYVIGIILILWIVFVVPFLLIFG